VRARYPSGNSATIYSEKLSWYNNETANSLEQFDFWRPGGHKYGWIEETREARCYFVDRLRKLLQVRFYHVNHAGNSQEEPNNPLFSLGYLKIAYMVGQESKRAIVGAQNWLLGDGASFTSKSNTTIPWIY
jgi:hypothetical protein